MSRAAPSEAGSKATTGACLTVSAASPTRSWAAGRPPAIPSTRKPEPVPELVSGRDRPSQRRLTAGFALLATAHAAAPGPRKPEDPVKEERDRVLSAVVVTPAATPKTAAGHGSARLCADSGRAYQLRMS
jgi:hypothetical protein